MDEALVTLLDKAVTTGLNVALVGEAGVGKEWTSRLLHKRRKATNFHTCDCLTGDDERWSKVAVFLHEASKSIHGNSKLQETLFLKDIQHLNMRQVTSLIDNLHTELLENKTTSSSILRAGIICSCEPEAAKRSPWREFLTQFFPIEMTLPSLQNRAHEIPSLVSEIVSEWKNLLQKSIIGIEAQALAVLQSYAWPGNVSELKSVLGYACAVTDNYGTISAKVIEKRLGTNLFATNDQRKMKAGCLSSNGYS